MNRLKRFFYILLFNLVISAAATAVILSYWERKREMPPAQVTVVMFVNPTQQAAVTLGTPIEALLSETAEPEAGEAAETLATPEPTEIIEYRVKSGDTLSSIAVNFEISIDDIMRLNGLTDPDLISVGEILFIPSGPLPTYTPVPPTEVPPSVTPKPVTPTPSRTPTASPTGNPARAIIESVLGVGDLANERVRISRAGLGELSLAGWQMEDGAGHTYTFPRLSLFEGGGVTLHTTKGLDTATNLFWGLTQPAWQAGEVIILRDALGQEQARYKVP
jgi:LysM repeat protein